MATNTYVALDKVTVGSNTASVTFTSINQGYTDLFIQANIQQVTNGEDVAIQFNSDTGSNYSRTYLCGDGSTAHSGRSSSATSMILDHHATPPTADSFSVNVINVENYSNTTTNKTVIARSNSSSSIAGTVAVAGLWRSTSAITSITVFCTNGSNIKAGSTFSLYGIKAAAVGAKATGGTIYSDATYFYHVFGATETFTPSQALTASVLVVGTGGVGGVFAGGGGAGGSIGYSASVSLASGTAYTATIGASGTIPKVNSSGNKVQSATASTNCTFSGGAISTITGTAGGNGSDTGAGGSNTAYSGGSSTGGGGAGFGAAGSSGPGGAGGTGVSTYSLWGVATGLGENVSGTYYFAGGGGGGTSSGSSSGAGGSGGGGAGAADGLSGTRYTGGGGGGAKNSPNYGDGGSGGLGVVIVRYAKA